MSMTSLLKALGRINWSSEVISVSLENWELGRVASSCHLSVDRLCQVMVSGFSSLLVFVVPVKLSDGTVTAAKPFSHRGRAVATKGRDVVRK